MGVYTGFTVTNKLLVGSGLVQCHYKQAGRSDEEGWARWLSTDESEGSAPGTFLIMMLFMQTEVVCDSGEET